MGEAKRRGTQEERATKVGIWLPPSVLDIIKAAGGENDFPRAMASIVGALPWIAAELSQRMTREDYLEFVAGMKVNLEGAWSVMIAANPKAAFDEMFAKAKRAVQ